MRRADRLLQIIQILRRTRRPVTAGQLAEELEVSIRTIYRDMVSLEAGGVPITGEAGVGYVMGDDFDLPPLMFTAAELEALMLGARMVETKADPALVMAARDAVAKIGAVLPDHLKPLLLDAPLFVASYAEIPIDTVDAALLRNAIRDGLKTNLDYADQDGKETKRTVWPVAIAYFQASRILVAWCELRQGFRHFRTDRIRGFTVQENRYPARRAALLKQWQSEINLPAETPGMPA